MPLKITLGLADFHWGGRDHMLRTRRSLIQNIVEEIKRRTGEKDNVEFQGVINGDMVVGRGIWRTQTWEQLLPDAHWQGWGAAYLLKGLDTVITKAVSSRNRWRLVKGNHDRTMDGTDLASDIAVKAATMGIPATFVGTETIVNLAPEGAEEHKCLFEHGYGYSAYYPFSYSLLRNTERKLISYEDLGTHIQRCCFGHSHWLLCGFSLSPWRMLDSLGGLQRNDRAILGRGVRDVGGILYIHDGRSLEVVPVRPGKGALSSDLKDAKLEASNRAEIATIMNRVLDWLIRVGLVEPDIIAKA